MLLLLLFFARTPINQGNLLAVGTLSVARAHIAAETTQEERMQFMGYAGAIQFMGFSLMPGADSVLSHIELWASPRLRRDEMLY